jgi:hypothetical protein
VEHCRPTCTVATCRSPAPTLPLVGEGADPLEGLEVVDEGPALTSGELDEPVANLHGSLPKERLWRADLPEHLTRAWGNLLHVGLAVASGALKEGAAEQQQHLREDVWVVRVGGEHLGAARAAASGSKASASVASRIILASYRCI